MAIEMMRRLAIAALFTLTCAAQPTLEYEVKAAFLLNFTRFIDWPPDVFAGAASPFTICILGKDPFGRALDDIVKDETVGGRRLTVARISQVPAAHACQMVYLDPAARDLAGDLHALGRGVLTVGEGDRFVADSGMVGFIIADRRVRFDINRSAAEAAGLKISSRLLRIARSVKE